MLINNLFKSRRRKNYSVRKTVLDDRKNLGNNYRDNILKNAISSHIMRNSYMNDFVVMLQQILADIIDTVAQLHAFKSYTIKKDDTKIR